MPHVGLIQPHVVIHLRHDRFRRLEDEVGVVALGQLVDGISQPPRTHAVLIHYLPAGLGDNVEYRLDVTFDRGVIGLRVDNESGFVKRHQVSSLWTLVKGSNGLALDIG
jgi:hypothetical protein